MLKVLVAVLLAGALAFAATPVAAASPAPPGEQRAVTVAGDPSGTVDIRVRSDPKASRPDATPRPPAADDAPEELDEPCLVPSQSPERYAPDCLAAAGGATPAANVVEAALEARGELVLPPPTVTLRPRVGSGGVTGAQTRLQTDASHWAPNGKPLTKRVQAGAVWAAVSAAAVRLNWLPGDGSAVTCPAPSCGYTYRRWSAAQPGGQYTVTVRVTWAVTWVGSDGTQGALAPLTVATTFPYTVRQADDELIRPG